MKKSSKGKAHTPGHWSQKFAEAMRDEREQRGLTLEKYPKSGRYQEEIEQKKKVSELSYLLRLIMWFRRKGKPLPSERRLRGLLILWALARLETVVETSFDFHEQVATDYDEDVVRPARNSPESVKEEYKEEIESLFRRHWPEHGPDAQKYFQETLNKVYEELESEPVLPYDPSAGCLPTLEYFPESFKPLVVIVGEAGGLKPGEPEHISELFRLPQSFLSLYYLPRLNLDPETEVVSDRLLLELRNDEERAAELLGDKHILVIGSPLVNAFSRHLVLNKKLIFNFVFERETYLLGQDFYDDMIETGLFGQKSSLSLFRRLMDAEPAAMDAESAAFTNVSGANKARIKEKVLYIRALLGGPHVKYDEVTNKFHPDKIFSPLKQMPLTGYTRSHHENAIVTLGENLWANRLRKRENVPRRALILVSGTHELSTSLAVRALSSKATLQGHPLGGVLDITKGRSLGPNYVAESDYTWLTQPYRAQEVLDSVGEVLQSFDTRPSAFGLFEKKEELEAYREIVKQYVE